MISSSSTYNSISLRARCLTTSTPSIPRKYSPTFVSPFQKRFASEDVAAEVETQAEPEADGATEAQRGENSIAASTSEMPSPETFTKDTTKAADHQDQSAAASAITSATESVSDTVSNTAQAAVEATDSIRESATNIGSAFGIGAATPQTARWDKGTQQQDQPQHTLYIGNLFFDVTEDLLRQELSRFGNIKSVKIVHDGRGLSKGYAFCVFSPWSEFEIQRNPES